MRRVLGMAVVAIFAACGGSSDDLRELRDGQRQILAKLNDLEKKVERPAAAARPAAPGRPDPSKVYEIPVGKSPIKGPADAPVALVEFSDFQ